MRRPATFGLQAADLDPDLVIAGGGQRLARPDAAPLQVRPRPEVHAHLVGDPLLGQLRPVGAAAQLNRLGAMDELRRRLRGEGFGQHVFGRVKILFDVGGAQRQDRADPLEPVPFLILGQAGRVVRVIVDAEQIVNGVGVFLAGEPVEGHALPAGKAGELPLLELARQPFHDLRRVVRVRSRLVFRRHLTGADPVHHVGPVPGRSAAGEVPGEGIDPERPLLLLLAVASDAIFLKERLDRLVSRTCRRIGRRCGGRRRFGSGGPGAPRNQTEENDNQRQLRFHDGGSRRFIAPQVLRAKRCDVDPPTGFRGKPLKNERLNLAYRR